jgi:GT2 family glycosyltransferase
MLHHEVNRGLSAARNTGILASNASVVAFTDDDCVPHMDWVAQLAAVLDRSDAAIVGGPVASLTVDSPVRRYLSENSPLAPLELELSVSTSLVWRGLVYLRSNLAPRVAAGERPVYSVVGANFAARRTVLDALHGFDEAITFAGDEEDLCRRAAEQGYRVLFTPGPVVDHDFERGLLDTLRRSFAYGRGSARNWIRRPEQGPAVYPLPIVIVIAACAASRWRALLFVALLAPPAFYVRHLRKGQLPWGARVLHAYLQFLQEVAGDVGFLCGWRAYRRQFERTPAS